VDEKSSSQGNACKLGSRNERVFSSRRNSSGHGTDTQPMSNVIHAQGQGPPPRLRRETTGHRKS